MGEPIGPTEPEPEDEDHDEVQSGLGRGLRDILGPPGTRTDAGGGGLGALFGAAGAAPAGSAAPRVRTGTDPPPPPLPLLPRGARRQGVVRPLAAVRPETVTRLLEELGEALRVDVAVHLGPGPGGGRLTLVRPERRAIAAPEMDALCSMVRAFVAQSRLTTDDFEAAGHHCVVFGPRPLTDAGVYVLGRRDGSLTMDERWAVHRHLVPAALPA